MWIFFYYIYYICYYLWNFIHFKFIVELMLDNCLERSVYIFATIGPPELYDCDKCLLFIEPWLLKIYSYIWPSCHLNSNVMATFTPAHNTKGLEPKFGLRLDYAWRCMSMAYATMRTHCQVGCMSSKTIKNAMAIILN